MRRKAQEKAISLGLPMKIVQAEPILGGERLTFHFTSEDRIDFRELVRELAQEFSTRIEMRQVGARDEARLIADYERCGQHCCCKQFLKVLKPISIKSAKLQKATLDPLKISGRCGRLMCCLRYEDETYDELSKRLPKMKKRVGTPHGIGIVIDRQILTQLVLVRLEDKDSTVAVPVEEIVAPEDVEKILQKPGDPLRGASEQQVADRTGAPARRRDQQDSYRRRSQSMPDRPAPDREPIREIVPPHPSPPALPTDEPSAPATETPDADRKKRRRRRRKRRDGAGSNPNSERADAPPPEPHLGEPPDSSRAPAEPEVERAGGESAESRKRRRRGRRRRRRGGPGSGDGPAGHPPSTSDS